MGSYWLTIAVTNIKETMKNLYYKTEYGKYILFDFEKLYTKYLKRYYSGKFDLIITSPPFPLNAKKQYGNLQGDEYKKWFLSSLNPHHLLWNKMCQAEL